MYFCTGISNSSTLSGWSDSLAADFAKGKQSYNSCNFTNGGTGEGRGGVGGGVCAGGYTTKIHETAWTHIKCQKVCRT